MNEWFEQAKARLEKELKEVTGQKEAAMAKAVKAAMLDFCQQDAEFAQAVVQGKSFSECMKEVAKNVGNSISDLDAYKKRWLFTSPGRGFR